MNNIYFFSVEYNTSGCNKNSIIANKFPQNQRQYFGDVLTAKLHLANLYLTMAQFCHESTMEQQ